jgi:hypothetical protein
MSFRLVPTIRAAVLLAALASPALAEVGACDTAAARDIMAWTLPRAGDERPVHVTFLSRAEGVKLPDWLAAQYPDEMTIILQYEFDRLVVDKDAFEVTVYFKGRPARLVIPFAAVKAFFDNKIAKCTAG